ncbi:hypothetical protein DBV39_12540 [Orrella marina]|uniref:Uncharacterized protein n=1 Tax=Orrella marina TaxID=2163011 RepID=A0A2R4XKS0_9BURK|nr:hypothetical protein DBV39_12540 [Orrella marina]
MDDERRRPGVEEDTRLHISPRGLPAERMCLRSVDGRTLALSESELAGCCCLPAGVVRKHWFELRKGLALGPGYCPGRFGKTAPGGKTAGAARWNFLKDRNE